MNHDANIYILLIYIIVMIHRPKRNTSFYYHPDIFEQSIDDSAKLGVAYISCVA